MGRGGVDLNELGLPVLLFRGHNSGEVNVYGQDPVRPADGFSAMDDICADCRTLWWRRLRQVVALHRTFPGHGACATDLSREPRDIEACLSAQASKLYHMGLREPIRRSTLSDANEARDWRIYADFAQVLIRQ